ncbi:hypothetical protein [Schlesneria paludicola]|nr:hypothetical protein [Schlesneria paludicola]
MYLLQAANGQGYQKLSLAQHLLAAIRRMDTNGDFRWTLVRAPERTR